MCTRCRGTGEITNAKGKADACPDCARAAEIRWMGRKAAPLPRDAALGMVGPEHHQPHEVNA